MQNIRVAIEGGAGYTAGELLRILLFHPQAKVVAIHSNSHHGKAVTTVHTDLQGETNLQFSEIDFEKIDLLFLCSGHGKSKSYLDEKHVPASVKVIDLSQDFRNETNGFVYGLPELQKEKIAKAPRVANPGCFATAIQLALLPLAASHLLLNDVHITAITGSTGAGQSLSETSHFSWRNNNVSVYKPFRHQHLQEIGQTLVTLQPSFAGTINLVPVRGNFSRGILASVYTTSNLHPEAALALYCDYYANHPFVKVVTEMPDLKQVVNTNKCMLYLERIDDKLLIVSLIDNLLKGASGQAVQNMNLMFGLDEATGLHLKGIGF